MSTSALDDDHAPLTEEDIHDLRALLNVIGGHAANLRDGIYGDLADRQRRGVLQIIEAVSSASQVIASAEGEADDTPVDALVQGTVDLIAAAARARNVAVSFESEGTIVAPVSPLRLRRALLNLLDNALRWSPEGGALFVSVGRGAAEGDPTRPVALVVVADEGPGIPRSQRGRVLEPGVRLSPPEGDRYAAVVLGSGKGLGLAIAKRMIERDGGRLLIDEHPGGGTSFKVELPLR